MSPTHETDLLAPFEIWEVMLDNSTIKFRKPLVLTPEWLPDDPEEPDENEYLSVKCPELGISAFGENRESLWDCIHSCIRMNWKHYVCEQNCNLSPLAKSIKQNLLAVAEAVDG